MLDPGKQQSILEAAAAAFETLGFRKASIGAIAKRAGVGKGTVYLLCKSKEELFYRVVLRDLRRFIATQAERIDPLRPADELLAELATSSLEHLERRPLVRWLIAGSDHTELPRWREKFDKLRELTRVNIGEILRLGVEQGLFRDDLEIDETAALLYDIQFAGYIFHVRTGRALGIELLERSRRCFDLVMHGLLRR